MGSETVRMIWGARGTAREHIHQRDDLGLGAARSNCRLQHCGVHRLSVGSLTRSG